MKTLINQVDHTMKQILYLLLGCLIPFQFLTAKVYRSPEKAPVDYVNPYIGNISHLLVPTYPTVHLPNSMLRYILNVRTSQEIQFMVYHLL